MMKYKYSLCLLFFISAWVAAEYPQDYFRAPLNIPLVLSGTYCELRPNHFHAGIDIKTNGSEGYRVYSAADGYVSRVKVQSGGYGKAIYVRHPNGYTTVYAHLSKFNDEINAYVEKAQYRRESFTVDLYPDAGALKVKKGEKIALSGNSGGSGGPHLHFEIRDTGTEHPLNPLLFGINVEDTKKPTINKIAVYSIHDHQHLENPEMYTLKTKQGTCSLENETLIVGADNIALGINTYDQLNGANNHNGVYSVELLHNEETVCAFDMRESSFGESRYINSHLDYGARIRAKKAGKGSFYLQKCFRDPGNKLSIYDEMRNEGVINIADGETHRLTFKVKDAAGNLSQLNFKVKQGDAIYRTDPPFSADYFKQGRSNYFEATELKLDFDAKAFYRDIYFQYETAEPMSTDVYSLVHKVHDGEVPVHSRYTISILPNDLPSDLKNKALVAYKDVFGNEYGLTSKWDGPYLTARPREFGDFYITTDTTAPTIKAVNISEGKNMAKNSTITMKISDDLSGIKSYRGTIDGEWVLMDYDAKTSRLIHTFDHRTGSGSHTFKLVVKDGQGNSQTYIADFKR